jgi:hypothetical protein
VFTSVGVERGTIDTYDYRIRAARDFLATAPASDFTRLLADVVDVADDFHATDLDESVSKITSDGGIYIAPAEVSRLCPSCRTLAIKVLTRAT